MARKEKTSGLPETIQDFGPALAGGGTFFGLFALEMLLGNYFANAILLIQRRVLEYMFGPQWPDSMIAFGLVLGVYLLLPIAAGIIAALYIRSRIGPPANRTST